RRPRAARRQPHQRPRRDPLRARSLAAVRQSRDPRGQERQAGLEPLVAHRLAAVRPLLAALIALLVLMPAAAHADGGPASDVLVDKRVFYPYYDKVPKASQQQLQQTIADAKKKGYAVRVAMIGKVYDLGSAGLLYKKPQPYSQFLAQELAQFNTDWVLVVMPN